MRIYAVADIHGQTEKILKIKAVIAREKPDILVIAGDVTRFFSPLNTLTQLREIPVPVLCICGNSDSKQTLRRLQTQKNITILSAEPVTCLGSRFIGLNGTLPLPFLSKISLRETQSLRTIKSRITRKTILVVHPPPRGVRDRVGGRFSAGSNCLRRFIENHPPLMVLCGHIHEQAGYQFFNGCLVVNCAMNKKFSGAIIEVGDDTPLTIKMEPTGRQTDKEYSNV